jgi:hypothetical protein
MTPSQVKESRINLPNKFAGTYPKYWSFFNQVQLIIWLHPHHYPNGPIQIDFIGTLLSSTTLTWFAPLLKQ